MFTWSVMRYDQCTKSSAHTRTNEQLLVCLDAGEAAGNRWTRVSEWLYRTADPNTETFRFLTHSSVLITQAFSCASPESLFPIIYLLAIHLFPFLLPTITPPHIHSLISSTASLRGETDGEPLTLRPEDERSMSPGKKVIMTR